jgi:hypothetical protein
MPRIPDTLKHPRHMAYKYQERQHHNFVSCADICQESVPIRGSHTLKLAGVVHFILYIDLGSDNPKNVLSCCGKNKRDPHAHNTCS